MAEREKTPEKTVVIHYTDEEGLKGILEDGVINPSQSEGPDAVMGTGVYVNTMDPDEHTKSEIAENNYDDGTDFWEDQRDKGKCDYAIEMEVDADKVKLVMEPRNIGVHEDPIHLNDVDYTIKKVSDDRSDCCSS